MPEPPPAGPPPAEPAHQEPGADEGRPGVAVTFEHSASLPALLEQLGLSVLLSTYQAGRVVSLGVHQGELRVAFSRFDQAMGLARTPSGVAVGSRDAVWQLPANREIAARIAPAGEHDIAFLARTCHHSGPLLGHDLAWGGDQLWIVNTLFNGLATIEAPWSFVPRWKPPFISAWAPGDRCHLNGLAMADDGTAPAWVTALGETDSENGWREHKATGGCLIHVPTGAVVLRGLAMPHSPRLYRGQLYLLDSGHGTLVRVDPLTGERTSVARLPGFTRGLDCFAGHAFVGLSQIRETAVFGGLPLQQQGQELRCGVAIVDLSSGRVVGLFWFHTEVEEVFAVVVLPGYSNPALIGPDTLTDDTQTVWLVPPPERSTNLMSARS
ncbi:MAG: TIGR03032 family protein [Cyanobacteriota bacterium]|nr:TIGR03032 family protein [Cyanobacteriota bacterium]